MKVIDMHCDTIAEIRYSFESNSVQSLRKNSLQIDLEKMQKGDYLLQNFALFVNLGRPEDAFESVNHLVDVFYQEVEKNKDLIRPVTTYQQIEENRKLGLMSALLTVEEGGVCKGDLAFLRNLYRLGVRMMTITWNHENELGFPNEVPKDAATVFPYQADASRGLKERGLEFLEEMEKLGMIVDVSHLSDAGFWDVLHHTTKPFVASHSNARAMCGHCRNLTDEMIKAMAERGGVIGLNYCASFLMDPDANGEVKSRVERMAEHARYMTNLGGINILGLGSDFDGIEGDLELDGADKMPLLAEALRKVGFHESEIEKIFYGNVLNLYKELL